MRENIMQEQVVRESAEAQSSERKVVSDLVEGDMIDLEEVGAELDRMLIEGRGTELLSDATMYAAQFEYSVVEEVSLDAAGLLLIRTNTATAALDPMVTLEVYGNALDN